MKRNELRIIPTELLQNYVAEFDDQIQLRFDSLTDSELSLETFSFYNSVSAVFSSRIEGEQIELDSYIKHRRFGVKYLPDYTRKIDDLYETYLLAQRIPLNEKTVLESHALLTKHILHPSSQGGYRTGNMFVLTKDGRIEYVAASPDKVAHEMSRFFQDLRILLEINLSFAETLFFASMIHLVFVKIHPFEDGNGRTGRLLEKWFLGQKLGEKAWYIQSEKLYYDLHDTYYQNIRKLGLEYDFLDYSNSVPFLKMLPAALHSED
jgi:Fic family protein